MTAERILGRHRGDEPGATLLCVAGIHGNEPAGVLALQRVLEQLRRLRPAFAGELVGLTGNLTALSRGRRYVDTDLNRMWLPDRIESLLARTPQPPAGVEDRELVELHDALHAATGDSRGPVYLLDLHTTSGRSAPFGLLSDTPSNRAFALEFGVPLVLGLEQQIKGSLTVYASDQSWATMDFEGGPHDDPNSVDHHEAAIWIALAAAGNLPDQERWRVDPYRHRLAEATGGLPRLMEIISRHPVTPGDGFEMLPGFDNFHAVQSGQVVAHDRDGDVCIPQPARLLMPLYQGQGDDGFFLTRPLSRLR
jgi:succinylglutamate desuccinylase